MLLYYYLQKRALLFVLLTTICLPLVYSQSSVNDSLLMNLPSQQDTVYINQLQKVIPQLKGTDQRKEYAQLSIDLSKILAYQQGLAEGIALLAEAQRKENDFEAAVDNFKKVSVLAEKLEDIDLQFLAYRKTAYCLRQMGKLQEAYQLLTTTLQFAEDQGDAKLVAKSYFELGEYFRLQNEVEKAVDFFERSRAQYDEESKDEGYCNTTFHIGITLKKADTKQKQKEGIELLESLTEGFCWEKRSQYSKGVLLNNLGSAFVSIGDLAKGEKYLYRALDIKKGVGNPVSLAYTLNELSSLYLEKENPQRALEFARDALSKAEDKKNVFVLEDIYRNLSESSYKTSNFQDSYDFLQQHYNIKDSIRGIETSETIARLDAEYDSQKKEKALLEKDLVIAQQESRLNQFLFAGLALLSLIIGALIWYRNRLNRQRLEALKLQELDELKTNFFTNITHEFRTPLTVMLNSLPETDTENDSYFMSKQGVDMIRRNAERLQQLINQLLELSKLEAGELRLQLTENDLGAYLKILTNNFQNLATRKNIRLQFINHLKSEKYFFDVDKMEKVVGNLLLNAIKFTEEEGEINVWVSKNQQDLEISIQDSGIGIEADQLPYIFDRFRQLDPSATRAFEGTGVGLALVKELVKIHKGKVTVESVKGKGTVFKVVLPANKSAYPRAAFEPVPFVKIAEVKRPLPIQAQHKATVATENSGNKNRLSVLIVEDDPDLRLLLIQQLQEFYQVIEATNGAEGINLAIQHIPDLIISDIMMPQSSGHALCDTLKKDIRTNHIPIILLTAKVTQVEKNEGLETGADIYLTKPYNPQELLLQIRNLLQQRIVWQQRFAGQTVYRTLESPVQSSKDQFVHQLLSIIEKEMSNDKFGVEQLATAVHMSRSQLYRKVKALTDKTPNHFIREIRLERAKLLLESEAGNVSEIAEMVGFSNANYFYKSFKAHFGRTPGEILRKV